MIMRHFLKFNSLKNQLIKNTKSKTFSKLTIKYQNDPKSRDINFRGY